MLLEFMAISGAGGDGRIVNWALQSSVLRNNIQRYFCSDIRLKTAGSTVRVKRVATSRPPMMA